MEYTYYLVFKSKRERGELLFNIGSEEETSTLLRLSGRNTQKIFNKIVSILGGAGCIIPIQTGNPKIYSIRDDVGSLLRAYLIPIRKARKVDYWIAFLDELLTGKYSRLGETFSFFLESTISLSKSSPIKKKEKNVLSPTVVSSFSSALKVFVKTLKKREEKVLQSQNEKSTV